MGQHLNRNDGFYSSKAWFKVRAQAAKRDNYLCRRCGEPCYGKGNFVVNHIKRRIEFPHLALDLNNLETVCTRCHNTVCARDDFNPNRGSDANGIPNDPTSEWSNYFD